MSIFKIKTYTNIGLESFEIIIEADSNKSLPTIEIVGLPDASIKEAKERIRATFRNVGVDIPPRKIILNLAPSDIKKIGTRFDLPMAVAILMLINDNTEKYKDIIENSIFMGELGLDGTIKRVNGILPSVISAFEKGYKCFFIPRDNLYEVEHIKGISIFPADNFYEIVEIFSFDKEISFVQSGLSMSIYNGASNCGVDFSDIKGHYLPKRALTIAAAGLHNILMIGPPGSGKTMLSRAIQSILPPLDFSEVLEVSQIYSVIGLLTKENPMMTVRPFRQIHHTASKISIVGGGPNLLPGEISLSHKGILFFDELPEFPSQVMEVLRQPLEDRKIVISRAVGTVEYPANFMFVAAMNPCKCGYYKDREKACTCSLNDIKRYQSKISGPILDRFDMILEIPRENVNNILSREVKSLSSENIKNNVLKAWEIQKKRFENTNIKNNSDMSSRDIDKYITMDQDAEDFLKNAIKSLVISPRLIHRILKLSRTIADIEGTENIKINQIAESLQYRSKNMFVNE